MKLRQVLQDHQRLKGQLPTIHTFGFGYSIRSGLLQSIAEVGAGSYSFIPDAGMIGTVLNFSFFIYVFNSNHGHIL
jgi:hypothetical protein